MRLEERFTNEKLNIRSEDNGDTYIEGYAATYDKRSKLLVEGGKTFYEIIRKGAFTEGIASSRDIICCLDHDKTKLLGRTKSGTLVLESDDIGLRFSLKLGTTSLSNDTLEMIKRGDISELSFAFYLRNVDFKWSRLNDGSLLREITNFKSIKDVSLLQTDAAYGGTSLGITAREYEDIERKLNSNLDDYYNKLKNNFYN